MKKMRSKEKQGKLTKKTIPKQDMRRDMRRVYISKKYSVSMGYVHGYIDGGILANVQT